MPRIQIIHQKANRMTTTKATTIDEYISGFPEDVQQKLQQVRETIQAAAPEAIEAISYAIPTFKQNGNLVHFAGYANHIGLYPAPLGIKAFEKELAAYKSGKGSAQFPHDKPLPLDLISRIVKFNIEQNMNKPIKKK